MKPFRFKLKPLETMYERRERQTLETYAAALRSKAQAAALLEAAEQELNLHRAEWRRKLSAGMPAGSWIQNQLAQIAINEQRESRLAATAEAEQAVQEALTEVLLAQRQCESLGRMKQKQMTQWRRDLLCQEQKFMDDLSNRRHAVALRH